MNIEIVEANVADLPELSVLWEAMIKEVMPDARPNHAWWMRYVAEYFKHSDYKCFKAKDCGVTVGFIDGMLFADPSIGEVTAHGLNFYVLPVYRGIVGARLYLKLVKEGKARGAKYIDLICYKNTTPLWEEFGMNAVRRIMRKEI